MQGVVVRNRTCRACRGPHWLTKLVPLYVTTNGTPSASQRCIGTVLLQTAIDAEARTAAQVAMAGRSVIPAAPGAPATTVSTMSRSFSTPVTTTGSPAASNPAAISPKRSAGYRRARALAPGWTTAYGRSGSIPAAPSRSRAALSPTPTNAASPRVSSECSRFGPIMRVLVASVQPRHARGGTARCRCCPASRSTASGGSAARARLASMRSGWSRSTGRCRRPNRTPSGPPLRAGRQSRTWCHRAGGNTAPPPQ